MAFAYHAIGFSVFGLLGAGCIWLFRLTSLIWSWAVTVPLTISSSFIVTVVWVVISMPPSPNSLIWSPLKLYLIVWPCFEPLGWLSLWPVPITVPWFRLYYIYIDYPCAREWFGYSNRVSPFRGGLEGSGVQITTYS